MNQTVKRRNWRQYSLRSVLLVFLVVASFFAGRVSVTKKLQQMQAEAERQRAIAEMNQQRAIEAVYRLNVQLAEQTLAGNAVEGARERLLQRADDQVENLLRAEAGIDHAESDGTDDD